MGFDPRRLRRGEWLVALSAVVLLASMFLLNWYGPAGASSAANSGASSNAWNSLSNTRWLMLVTVAVAFALVYFQGSRRSPAVPVSLSVFVSVFAFIAVLALIYRVFIDLPGNGQVEAKAGAYVGLVSAIAMLVGGFLSMRDEGITDRDAPQKIETIRA